MNALSNCVILKTKQTYGRHSFLVLFLELILMRKNNVWRYSVGRNVMSLGIGVFFVLLLSSCTNAGLDLGNSATSSGSGSTTATLSGDGSTILSVDFQEISSSGTSDKTITLNNPSSDPMTSMNISFSDPKMQFKGGKYPGTGGTCGAILLPSATCTVVVSYTVGSEAAKSVASLKGRGAIKEEAYIIYQLLIEFIQKGIKKNNVVALKILLKELKRNHAPVAKDIKGSTNKDASSEITLNAMDPDDDVLTYSIVDKPKHGSVSGSDQKQTYTPNEKYYGPDSFTYKVNDGKLDSNVATVSITVEGENEVPVASSGELSVTEDEANSGTLVGSDSDGKILIFSIVTNGSKGKAEITDASTGEFTYTPFSNENGIDSFTFSVSDGSASTFPATISINITAVNDAPLAVSGYLIVVEDMSQLGQLVARDAERDPLIFSIVDQASKGSVNITNSQTGAFTYTPNENSNGSDYFTFKVNDGKLDSEITKFIVEIEATNDTPIALPNSYVLNEDKELYQRLGVKDPDSVNFRYGITTQPTKGRIALDTSNGYFAYVPNNNANGSDSFSFNVSDDHSTSEASVITIDISPVNDAPIAYNSSLVTTEDTPVEGQLNASDPEEQLLIYTITKQPTHGSILLDSSTGTYTYIPAADSTESDSFQFRVSDSELFSEIASVNISLTGVNDAPLAKALSLSTIEDIGTYGVLPCVDVDSSNVVYSIVSPPLKGTITYLDAPSGYFRYMPDRNQNGPDSFTYKVNDGQIDSNIGIVSINISPVDDSPIALSSEIKTNEDIAFDGTLGVSDIDSTEFTFAITVQPTNGQILLDRSSGSFKYTPNSNVYGSDSFSFSVSDGTTTTTGLYEGRIAVTILPVNDAPVGTTDSVTFNEDTLYKGYLRATDVDSTSFIYNITTQPQKGFVGIQNGSPLGEFFFIPNQDANGSDTFSYTISDGISESVPKLVNVTINPVDDIPFPMTGTSTTLEDAILRDTVVIKNPDGVPLNVLFDTQEYNKPKKGVVVITDSSTGTFEYTPFPNANGKDSFTFWVGKKLGLQNINIIPQPDAPEVIGNVFTVAPSGEYNGRLKAANLEGKGIEFTIDTQPSHGSVELLDSKKGTFRYIADPTIPDTGDSFTFRAGAFGLRSEPATVNIISYTQQCVDSRFGTNEFIEAGTLSFIRPSILLSRTDGKIERVNLSGDGSSIQLQSLNCMGQELQKISVKPVFSHYGIYSTDVSASNKKILITTDHDILYYINEEANNNVTTFRNFPKWIASQRENFVLGTTSSDTITRLNLTTNEIEKFNLPIAEYPVSQIHVNSDQSVLLVGKKSTNLIVTKLTADLQVDSDFGTGGTFSIEAPQDSLYAEFISRLQSDEKILIASTKSILRISENGTLERSFGNEGIGEISLPIGNFFSIRVMSNDKILLGSSVSSDFVFRRLNKDGAIDIAFNNGNLVYRDINSNIDYLTDFFETPDNKIIIIGVGNPINSKQYKIELVRYKADGSADIPPYCESRMSRMPVAGGAGHSGDPFTICSAAQMARLMSGDYAYYSYNIKLMADIDMDEYDGTTLDKRLYPIGRIDHPFTGSFNGNNKVVSNIKIDGAQGSNIGFFGYVDGGQIQNLTLRNVNITGGSAVGGLAGYVIKQTGVYQYGLIQKSFVLGGTVIGNSAVGGLVGFGHYASKILQSSANLNIRCGGGGSAGGLAGVFYGTIENSYAMGSVSGSSKVGGLVGHFAPYASGGSMKNSYSTNVVSGTLDQIGGAIGLLGPDSVVVASAWNSEVSTRTNGIGSGAESTGLYGITTSEMLDASNYGSNSPFGLNWDMANIWAISEAHNQGYPYLK